MDKFNKDDSVLYLNTLYRVVNRYERNIVYYQITDGSGFIEDVEETLLDRYKEELTEEETEYMILRDENIKLKEELEKIKKQIEELIA